MSNLNSSTSTGVNDAAGTARNFPRGEVVPRRYESLRTAESVAAHYATMHFFSRRGTPYAYECATCRAFHCGLDTGRPWHGVRWSHDCWVEFLGIHPDASEADAA